MRKSTLCFFLIAVWWISGTLCGNTQADYVLLKQSVEVQNDSTRVFLQDLIENPQALNAQKWEEMGQIILGFAPLAGRQYLVETGYVVSRILHYFPNITIKPPEHHTIVIMKPSLNVPVESMKPLHSLYTPPQEAEEKDRVIHSTTLEELILEKIAHEAFKREDVIQEAIEQTLLVFDKPLPQHEWDDIQINVSRSGRGVFLVFIRGFLGDKLQFHFNSRVQAIWYRELAVSKTNIPFQHTLTNDHVEFKQLNYYEANDPILREDFLSGSLAKSFIRSGVVLSKHMFNPPWDVRKGQTIMAQVEIDGVVVRAQVKVLKDGRIGEMLRATNITSGSQVNGVLEEGLLLRVTF